jgi:glycosyltransferase involved in cell wall biosynthesis
LRLLRRLQARDVDTWLVTHDSGREELSEELADCLDRVIFTSSLPGFSGVFTRGERLPDGPRAVAWGVTQLERQVAMRKPIREMVARHNIDVVHQPIGVAPSVPSALHGLGAPVVMGPLNGGLSMPAGFAERDSAGRRAVQRLRAPVSTIANTMVPGRQQASVVLVANDRTKLLLPSAVRRRARELSEIGVVSAEWPEREASSPSTPLTFAYLGRLVGWKGVDLLIEAFGRVCENLGAELLVIGDGEERTSLESQVRQRGLTDRVKFCGWQEPAAAASALRSSDVFVLPSLRESGGAVVMEAMACGLPVIVPNWGGPADIADDASGIRVAVDSRAGYIDGLAAAMTRLGEDSALRVEMGRAGRARVLEHFDWDVLIGQMIEIYEQAAAGRTA